MLWNIKNIEDLRTVDSGVCAFMLELFELIEDLIQRDNWNILSWYFTSPSALGLFRYDRNFLLQFKSVCTKRPDALPPLDSIGIDPSQVAAGNPRGPRGGGRRLNTLGMGGNPSQQRQAPISIGLGLGPGLANRSGFALGQFQSPSTSQSRFEVSSAARAAGVSFTVGRLMPVGESASQGGVGTEDPPKEKRTRSQRGRDRHSKENGSQIPVDQAANIEPLHATREPAEHQGVADSALPTSQHIEVRELMERKVTALLNRLTIGNFDSISDQIIECVNKFEQEKNGAILMQVTRLVFKRAKGEAVFSRAYAQLCHKMMEQVSPKIQDETIRNSEGQPVTGGKLFRKYLLGRCQEDFERRWGSNKAAFATSESEDEATELTRNLGAGTGSYPNEHYVETSQAQHQGVGLVRFIGELFRVRVLTGGIMHKSIRTLLSNANNPEEEMIMSLCTLLTTVGQGLDKPKAKNHMDGYFERIQEISKGNDISFRMRFMLLDVIEFRARHWQPRCPALRPTPPCQHSPPNDWGQRNVVRGGYRRGEHHDSNAPEPDGWNILSGTRRTQPSARAGDLSQFGKISKPAGIQFGPSSVFIKKNVNKQDSSIGRRGAANPFSILGGDDAYVSPPASAQPSRPVAPPRPKTWANLIAANSSKWGQVSAGALGVSPSAKFTSKPTSRAVDEDKIQNRVNEDLKEYLGIEDVDEAIMALEALPFEHRHLFVDKLITAAMDGGNKVVALTERLFSAAHSRSVISPEGFERGFLPTIEMADDLSIDVPKTYEWLARMMHAAGLDKAKTEEMAGKISVYGEPRILPKELLMKEYDKLSSA